MLHRGMIDGTVTVWADLEQIIQKAHDWLYDRGNKVAARRYLNRLQRALDGLPPNNQAILREEGLALLHELEGDVAGAVRHRKREIKLMEKLHDSVRKSVAAGEYDAKMAASILKTRNTAVLRKRQAILHNLESQNGRVRHR